MWCRFERAVRWGSAVLLGCLLAASPIWARERESGPAPAIRIPVAPLGYRAPGKLYMLARYSSSSLDFLDPEHLLFTFRQPRLLARGPDSAGLDQMIQAKVLELPDGRVVAEDEWALHDRGRYLWRLAGDDAMLRIGSRLYRTDTSLKLKPMVNSETPLRDVETSPDGRLLVMQSDAERHTPEEHERLAKRAALLGNDPPPEAVQIHMIRLDIPKLMLKARADEPGGLPATVDGFFTHEQVKGNDWRVRFHPYEKPEPTGGDVVAEVSSTCPLSESALNDQSVLVMSCPPRHGDRFVAAYNLRGQQLWVGRWQSNFTWPALRMAQNGSSVAISWLAVDHPVTPADSIDDASVQGQILSVLDSRSGGLRLALVLDPITSAGGNFALSADGNRLAVLNHGAIEVYDLPKAPPPPAEQARK